MLPGTGWWVSLWPGHLGSIENNSEVLFLNIVAARIGLFVDILIWENLLYSEVAKETVMTELKEKPKTSKEAMTAIIMTGIAIVVCILACATVSIIFILNAPW